MGGALSSCKSALSKTKPTPKTINETHLEKDENVYKVDRNLENEFLKNTEDLIQEITTNSKWAHYETRYLLSQFRKLQSKQNKKDATNLEKEQFIQYLPTLLASLINNTTTTNNDNNNNDNNKTKKFEENTKNVKHLIKLFSTTNDEITFQSFANILSKACRGEPTQKAECLVFYISLCGTRAISQNYCMIYI